MVGSGCFFWPYAKTRVRVSGALRAQRILDSTEASARWFADSRGNDLESAGCWGAVRGHFPRAPSCPFLLSVGVPALLVQ